MIPTEPKVLPPVSRSQASLVRAIVPALPSILQRVEVELKSYNQKHDPDFHTVIRHPHIWLSSEEDDGVSWTFVVGRTDNPDFGYDLLFRGTEFVELCGRPCARLREPGKSFFHHALMKSNPANFYQRLSP